MDGEGETLERLAALALHLGVELQVGVLEGERILAVALHAPAVARGHLQKRVKLFLSPPGRAGRVSKFIRFSQ